MNPADFLVEFREEAAEKLDAIASQLLLLEREPTNLQAVREMFLAAHTVKGGASMLRLADIQELAHALEDVLAGLRDQARTLDPATADLLFQTVDRLRALVLSASSATMAAEADPQVLHFIERVRAGACSADPPAQGRVEERAPDVRAVPTPAEDLAAAGGQHRALVVDDSATVRELHAYLLRQLGYVVDCVAEGDRALAHALRAPYALVVAGLELGGLSGLDLTRSLRSSPGYAAVPIILVSARADAERCRRAVDAGAQALLRKASYAEEQLTRMLAELGGAERHTDARAA